MRGAERSLKRIRASNGIGIEEDYGRRTQDLSKKRTRSQGQASGIRGRSWRYRFESVAAKRRFRVERRGGGMLDSSTNGKVHGKAAFDGDDYSPAHVMIGSRSRGRATSLAIPHRCTGELPPRSLSRLAGNAFVVSSNLALCQAVRGEGDFIRMLKLLWEACGTYCTYDTGLSTQKAALFNLDPLIGSSELIAFCRRNSSIGGAAKIVLAALYLA